MHRSPGVFFDHDKGKTHSSGKLLFAARIIPYRGSWLDFEFDAKDIVHARIDRRRKLPVTTLLYALGMDGEEILSTFYKHVTYKRHERRLAHAVRRRALSRHEAVNDLIDAKTGEVVVEAGKKITAAPGQQLAEKGLKELLVDRRRSVRPATSPRTSSTPQTGEIYARGRRRDRREDARRCSSSRRTTRSQILDIDHVNVGAYIRNTLAVDKNENREQALFDIYRVMRPGEPPTLETAEALFNSLFFDPERYDLSAVGRVKMNMRLELDAAGHRARAAQGGHPRRRQDAGRSARRQGRDRRYRQSRQPPGALGRRADGEPVPGRPAAHGAGDQGAHVVGRDRHGDAAGPDQRQAGGGGGARVLRLLAAVAVHGPDQSAVRDHPQAPPVGARTGRSDPRARRLRGARRAPDPLRPHLPDRDAGRAEYRPDQLAGDLRAGQQIRLHREPVPQGHRRQGDRRGGLSVGDGGGEALRRPGQRRPRQTGSFTEDLVVCRHAGDVHAGAARQRRPHGRVAEAARVGGRGADPVPRERRRQPRADGLQHAAPGGAAGARRGAARRHRHGADRGARLRRRDRGPPHRRGRPGRRHAYRHPRDRETSIRRSRASTSTG